MKSERWIDWRNRLLASQKFQRWAARFPLTRPVARSKARALFDLTAGFVYSQVLAACIELELLDMLATGPLGVAEIAVRCDLPVAGAARLLRAAESLGLVEAFGDGRFALGGEGAALLGNPGVAEMVRHHRMLYADLADPVALLRRGGGGGQLAGYWPYATGQAGDDSPYSALMAASQPMIAEQVLDAYPFGRHRHLLDIGGGEGAFLAAVAARHPALDRTLFDLPAVVARAKPGDRLTIAGGSFFSDALPRGADIVSLVRILHDHDDVVVAGLLRKIAEALPPGDTLLIAEPMAETRGARASGGAYFGMYLLAMGSGRPRSLAELGAMLRAAGFAKIREHKTKLPMLVRVVSAARE